MDNSKKSIDTISDLNSITKTICDFFKGKHFEDRALFFSEDLGFPSYHDIRGEGYIEPPDNVPLTTETWPVDNKERKDKAEAVHACERLARKLLVKGRRKGLTVLSRNYMIQGTTLPIRIEYEIDKTKEEANTEALYVKQMHLNRIFLGVLYHIAMGRDYSMAFSESTVVEEETSGPTIQQQYAKDHEQGKCFLQDPKIRRELVKLSTISYFLALNDIDNGANTILDQKRRFDVIDFDKAFWPIGLPQNPYIELINPFTYQSPVDGKVEVFELPYNKLTRRFEKGEIERLVREETERIHHNIKKRYKLFRDAVETMSTVDFYNLSVKELFGEKDIVSYFLKRHDEFRPK